jgi:hypothetical protein
MGEVSSQACHHLHAAGLETREARTWSLPVLVSDLRLFDARSVQAETCHRPSPTRWASQRCAAKLATVKRQAARSGRNTHTRASERTASHRNSSQGKRHNERARATKIDYSIRVVLPCTTSPSRTHDTQVNYGFTSRGNPSIEWAVCKCSKNHYARCLAFSRCYIISLVTSTVRLFL